MTAVPQNSPLILRVASLKRTFDFTALLYLLPQKTAERVATTLCNYYEHFRRTTAIARHCRFVSFINWLSNQERHAESLLSNSLPETIQPESTWCDGVDLWVSVLRAQYGQKYTTLAEAFGELFLCLDALAKAGIAPQVNRPTLPNNYHQTAGTKPSLCELQHVAKTSKEVNTRVQERIAELTGSRESEVSRYAAVLSSMIPECVFRAIVTGDFAGS